MNASDVIGYNDIDEDIPFELMELAQAAKLETMPTKSRKKYDRVYQIFKQWQVSYGVATISSDLILAYFQVLEQKKYKPTSMWAFHSMLKSTIRAYENIDIGKFCQVSAFLKTKSVGHKIVKAKVFAEEDVQRFIDKTDDSTWLDVKVVLIFGICGACRTDELTRIKLEDVEKHGSLFLVNIPKNKTNVPGSFTINGGFAATVQKYIDLRPARLGGKERIFVNYQRGKCTAQFIGKNKFAGMPRRIAEYLGLAEVERYTGHTFRRTSATILANSGADIETIMRHGRWRSVACAKGYIDDSLQYKTRTGLMIQNSILGPSRLAPGFAISSASTFVPTSVPTSVPTIATTVTVAAASSSVFANNDSLYQSSITDADLVDIVDLASQTYERERSTNIESLFDSSIPDDDLVQITERESQVYTQNSLEVRHVNNIVSDGTRKTGNAGDLRAADLSQSSNSALTAVLARSFKSVNFERMENCTFNFYMKN